MEVVLDKEKMVKAQKCLEDNGIDASETGIVLQALGYILLDMELENIIDWEYGGHGNKI